MTRYIGIRHRLKFTAQGEARPTAIAILNGDKPITLELEDETAELDFLLHKLPVSWRNVEPDEDIVWFDAEKAPQGVLPRHAKWRPLKDDEDPESINRSHLRLIPGDKKSFQRVTKLPTEFEGLAPGDIVGTQLGGSGDKFIAALSRQGENIGAEVWRTPTFVLSARRPDDDKDNDHLLFAELVKSQRRLFHRSRLRDREMIRVKAAFINRQKAMKARMGCAQQIRTTLIGQIFLSEEGRYPEGTIDDTYKQELANDTIYQSLVAEEDRREKRLDKVVKASGIWSAIFESIKGVGTRMAAGLIAPIYDIRRFWVEAPAEEMRELYQRSRRLEREGMFEADRDKVAGRTSSDTPHFQLLQMVRTWKRKNGKEAEAKLLDEAIECHKRRSKLRQVARDKGAAKLRRFCGVHVNNPDKDGNEVPKNRQFPRRRVGEVANYSPDARQTLYLLGQQFQYQAASEWGKRYRANKAKLRQVHPDVIEEKVTKKGKVSIKKRYTDGHINKMAIWRTLSQFVTELFYTWTQLEEAAQREENGIVRSSNSNAA